MNRKDFSPSLSTFHIKACLSLFFLAITCSSISKAQLQVEKFSISSTSSGDFKISYLTTSATASSFAIYGQANVNKFTGTPSIDISLGDVSCKSLSIPINLSYQKGKGIKPSEFPGPLGNGWFLNLGGSITRISKGISSVSFPNPETVPAFLNMTEGSDWSSNEQMLDNIMQPKYPTTTSYSRLIDEITNQVVSV